ncbi:MAG TPA: HAMP domain-containing protein, partial [Candidatus Nitrosotenuis sp.]|nr:HAMP domain-containing protein [Candidatus Nitrosotenuis sp.]
MSSETQRESKSKGTSRTNKLWLALGGLLLSLLLAAVFTLGSLQIPFEPDRWDEVLLLFALSTFIVALFVVFLFVFLRTLLRTWLERRAGQLGARFRTKMVAGAMAISLLPVVFMFFASYGLLNRTLNRWFPRPLELATEQSQSLLNDLGRAELHRLRSIATLAAGLENQREKSGAVPGSFDDPLSVALRSGADAAWTIGASRNAKRDLAPAYFTHSDGTTDSREAPDQPIRVLPSGAEVWTDKGSYFIAAHVPLERGGQLYVGRLMPEGFLSRFNEIEAQAASYNQSKQGLRAFKNQLYLAFGLFTVLLLFSATWAALFLAKQVTVPIQALAEGTKAVSAGNFEHRVEVPAQDELGALVQSFNQMTAQLADSRKQIDDFTRSLQEAVQELERRRKVIEAILENIPTAVFSLDENGQVLRANPAVVKLFGESARDPRTLVHLVNEDTARTIQLLMRKALRMGTASREMEIALPGRVLHAAVTVTALGPRRANPGFIVVIDDLSELLRAQKAAAWQEVAQRIAHEIKNPLTPIQLSVQRLQRFLGRAQESGHRPPPEELETLVAECTALMQGEVTALKTLVDEFSQFARFPAPKPAPADLNAVAAAALDVFSGRLDGITIRTEFAAALPPVRADEELLRRVLVNLIDNAVEAMEGSTLRELRVETALEPESDSLRVVVADSG